MSGAGRPDRARAEGVCRTLAALIGRFDRLEPALAPGAEFKDHRPLGFPPLHGHAAIASWLESFRTTATELAFHFEDVIAARPDALVGRWRNTGIERTGGGPFERVFLSLNVFDAEGRIRAFYIEAKDPDGDMLRIVSVVNQVGYGHYPSQWVYLKPQYGKKLRGYLQGNFYSKTAAPLNEGTQITLKVSVFDKAGNESNEVVFRLTFLSGGGGSTSPPAPFDQGDNPRLGYISFDLRNPGTY